MKISNFALLGLSYAKDFETGKNFEFQLMFEGRQFAIVWNLKTSSMIVVPNISRSLYKY